MKTASFPTIVLSALWLAAPALAAQHASGVARLDELHRVDVEFKLDQPGVASPDAVFVTGDLTELGEMDPTRSIQLVSLGGSAWRVPIALPTDREYHYQYLVRSARVQDLGDPSNGAPLTALVRDRTPRTRRGPGTKTLQARTSLVDPWLHWRQDEGAYAMEPLELVGPGRAPGEIHLGVRSFGAGRREVEFFLTSADGSVRDPADPTRTYATELDAIFLQDEELFSYVPAASVSPMRRAYTDPFSIHSSVLGQTRTYRVMLPRGYDEHVERRYPVLYHYDGQHLWDVRAGQFGFWDRDGTRMANLVRSGAAGELIQVGIDHPGSSPEPCVDHNRARDCMSPEDRIEVPPCGFVRGEADRFLVFVVDELKPVIDASYRTRPDRAHTFATGYSLGAVFALYAGWEFPATFGTVAPQSGSFWIPNFPARVRMEPRRAIRIYLDTGDTEDSISGPAGVLRDDFLARIPGYVLERDFRYSVGFGQDHTFTNGGRRVRAMMTFLWPSTSETAHVPWP